MSFGKQFALSQWPAGSFRVAYGHLPSRGKEWPVPLLFGNNLDYVVMHGDGRVIEKLKDNKGVMISEFSSELGYLKVDVVEIWDSQGRFLKGGMTTLDGKFVHPYFSNGCIDSPDLNAVNVYVDIGEPRYTIEQVLSILPSEILPTVRQCLHCLKFAQKTSLCAGCNKNLYCSKECQHDAWHTGHSKQCINLNPIVSASELPAFEITSPDLLQKEAIHQPIQLSSA